MTLAVVDQRSYITRELEEIQKHKWEMGFDQHRPISSVEAVNDFETHPYDLGLTAEDWYHINAVRDVTTQIAEGKLSLDSQFPSQLLKNISGTIEKYWETVGMD